MKERIFSDAVLNHSHTVADYMYRHSREYGLDPESMFILGLLHDIGTISGYENGHGRYGACILQKEGYKYCREVELHELIDCNIERLLYDIELNKNKALILLVEANMKVDNNGELVGYAKRIENMMELYGRRSQQYDNTVKVIDKLKECGRVHDGDYSLRDISELISNNSNK